MHLLYKVYCRLYQGAFYLAKPFMPYKPPRILNAMAEIPGALRERGVDRVLLVTDPFLRQSGATAPLEALLANEHIPCAVYDQTQANPTVHNVEAARQMYLDEQCRGIIAFGGGSAMDCAKAVGARIVKPNKPLARMEGLLKVMKRLPCLVAIPTTAGTGSEVTPTAVITDPEKKHKYAISDFSLTPPLAVLDPAVTYTLPPHLTATTGMDALTHAVEAFIGRSTTPLIRRQALEATRLILQNIEKAYQNGTDAQARAHMLKGSCLAGEAFSMAYVGYVHAVAHSLGGEYNTPHGLANAVLLPIFLRAYGPAIHKKLHKLAVYAGLCAREESPARAAELFIQRVEALNQRMGIPRTFDFIRPQDIDALARHADREANPFYPVPVLMDAQALAAIYRTASKGG